MDQIEFEVGSTHENEKGAYEVLSVDDHHGTMVIRWENGDEADTAISLQKRIIERMRFERDPNNSKYAKGRKRAGAIQARFDGFKETDFTGGVAGTTWRTQKALGGAVTMLLTPDGLQIKSWAVSRKPEIQWMDAKRRERYEDRLQANLFVKLDKKYLYYGFYVKSSPKPEVEDDWDGFLGWLGQTDNESWLKAIVDEFDLRICDMKNKARSFDGSIRADQEKWRLVQGEATQDIASLAEFLKQLPPASSIDLHIAKATPKDDTMARGQEIVSDISSLFDMLMPMYKAVTGSGNQ